MDPTSIGSAVVTVGGVIVALAKSHIAQNKRMLASETAQQARLMALEATSKAREDACVIRLQAIEDQRREDANGVINRNTANLAETAASNRELSGAINRLVVAVATLPGQDGERRLKDINRQAADLTPQAHPFVPESAS